MWSRLCWTCLAAAAAALLAQAADSPVKSDESVIFIPKPARLIAGNLWEIPIHGWIFEDEMDSAARATLIELFRKKLDVAPAGEEARTLRARARWFVVDNQGGKDLSIRIGDWTFPAGTSGGNGYFRSTVHLKAQQIDNLRRLGIVQGNWLSFHLVARDGRTFTGQVQLVEPEGVSVISDIDDTIKLSNVADRHALVENTFTKPFRAVEGMSDLYRRWAEAGATFHYVSASPYQLYVPLREWIEADKFPMGSFRLKEFRWKDETFLNLFAESDKIKSPAVEALLRRYPARRFILMGDSGEKDPEMYGELARRYPKQVQSIFIRQAGDEPIPPSRLEAAFRDLPKGKWKVFRTPAELSADGPRTRPASPPASAPAADGTGGSAGR